MHVQQHVRLLRVNKRVTQSVNADSNRATLN